MTDPVAQVDRPGNTFAQARYVVLAGFVGILVGTIGSYFHKIIEFIIIWPNYLAQHMSGIFLVVTAALITMICTVFAAFIVRRYAPEASGSGVQEIEGAMAGLRDVRWWRVLPVKFLMGIVAIGSGLVLGREGPTIHIGASISAAINQHFKMSETERRGMLAAGAAAGLACAFNAPLAAILFIIEETHKQFPYTFRTYMGVILASLTAAVMTQIIGGTGPDLPLPESSAALAVLPAFIVLGCIIGVVGVCLNACIMWAVDFASYAHQKVPYLYPAIIGLIIGGLFIVVPYSVTGGESVIRQLVRVDIGIGFLLLLAVLRYFTMVGSYSSGVPGGIFAPILTLATCIGLAFGFGLEAIFPQQQPIAVAFAIAAMGGLFTASVRAPVVGVALTLELTGAYGMVMPLITTCLVANLVAEWLGGKPIYEQLLDRTLKLAGIAQPDKRPNSHTGIA